MPEKKPPSVPANDQCIYILPKDFSTCVDGPSTQVEYIISVKQNDQKRYPHIMPSQPELLTPVEAAEMLRIGKSTVYEMIRTNQIPCLKIRGQYRIPRWRLMEWINAEMNK